MRIAHVLLPSASQYERKSQRADRAALSASHEVLTASLDEVRSTGAQVVHIYASRELPAGPLVGFPLPYVCSVSPQRRLWPLRQAVEPGYLLTHAKLPEAVEDTYFDGPFSPRPNGCVVGTFIREPVRRLVDETHARIERFRDDVVWRLFDHVPAPEDLAGVDLWVDPATSENDLDGFVAEALVVGLPVIAARTAVNSARLEHGRTGTLVPPGDPNEMTHAILSLLFKPEVASNKVAAARQTASKFRSRQRLRVLAQMYKTLIE